MSKGPGGMTVTINCMIIAGFPGIGKSTTYAEMKAGLATARVADMDVKDFGTTNGINVADPAAYVNQIKLLSADKALIFCTIDPTVRQKLREAGLFYVVVAPEFPPAMAAQLPGFRPDPFLRASYMKRFKDNLGANVLAGQLLDGKGYEDVITECFNDPMPHLVSPFLNKEVVGKVWEIIEGMTRQVLTPGMLTEMGVQRPANAMLKEMMAQNPDFKLPPGLQIPGGLPPM